MVELLINNERCVLPGGYSWKIKKTNIFSSGECEHTLDIDIDLNEAINARIFGHINREDTSKQQKDMVAAIYEGNKLRLKGDVYILSINNDTLKIQIVGESDTFTYYSEDADFEDGKLRINKLNLGNIQDAEITNTEAVRSVLSCYPQCNYVCMPTIKDYVRRDDKGLGDKYNNFGHKIGILDETWRTTLIAHPYLLFVVNKISQALGYNVGQNDLLSDEQAVREFIVINTPSLKLSDHLPSWTVAKFFREIEKKYNVICKFNRDTKTVDIISYKQQVEKKLSYLKEVFDDKEYEYQQDEKSAERNFTNVKYDFPDTHPFYKEADLGSDIEALCERKDIDNINFCSPHGSKDICIYKGVEVVRRQEDKEYIVPVNIYRHRGDDKSDDVIKLSIIPSIFVPAAIYAPTDLTGDYYKLSFIATLLSVFNQKETEETGDADQSVDDMITNGVNNTNPDDSERICVAIYNGYQQQDFIITENFRNYYYPEIAIPFFLWQWNNGSWEMVRKQQKYSLELDEIYRRYYTPKGLVNKKVKLKKKFLCDDVITPNGLYCINNKIYFCDSIEYTINEKGLDKVATGEFYPILAGN